MTGLTFILSFALLACAAAFRPRASGLTTSRLTLKMGTLLEEAKKTGYFNTAIKAIDACGLTSTLNGPGPFTLYLPSDDAFSKLPAGELEGLLKDIPKLTDILKFHVHPGKHLPMRTGRTLNTLLIGDGKDRDYPKQLTVKVTNWTCISFIFGGNELPAQVMGTGDGIKYTGIVASNGLIHELNQVLVPYEGVEPPKITFIGFGGITEKPRLQQGYYGPEAGKGRNEKFAPGTLDYDKNFKVGDAWQEGCNYVQAPDANTRVLG